jgi:hypothetical protein
MTEFELLSLGQSPDSQQFSNMEFLQQTPQKRHQLFMSAFTKTLTSSIK